MKCPFCGFAKSEVVDSRPQGDAIRRRRECVACKKRFTTYELIEAVPLLVVKKDGSREVFDRGKILTGLVKSCYKRPVSREQLEELVSQIESELQSSLRPEVSTSEIGEMVMERLRALDEVSYVRFASVYREFKDADTFLRELELLKKEREEKA